VVGRSRAKRPARPGLTRARILAAALELVDRRGLDALTMRSLGDRLGVEAMSLYRHFPNKQALLGGVVDRVLAEIEIGTDAADWRAGMRKIGRSFWRVLQAHPNAIPLLLTTPSITHRARELSEFALRMFGAAGLGPTEAHRAFRVFQALILGIALMDRARPAAADLALQLTELAPAGGEFPLLRAALADPGILDSEGDFELGLDLMVRCLT
jgi:AcrR family transcriptional regulator